MYRRQYKQTFKLHHNGDILTITFDSDRDRGKRWMSPCDGTCYEWDEQAMRHELAAYIGGPDDWVDELGNFGAFANFESTI